jgi:excinuclease ABC subunit B
MFQLESRFQPAGDQPQAIASIVEGFLWGEKSVTLLGATGTGKTFTMAHTIQQLQKPTLVICHNKTLAAQLATEFKHFFPKNAVHYFVSYFDYYQPESFLPEKGLYIEKEATINKEIEMYRLATLSSLLSREDVIVVASASSLYGLGQKEFFEQYRLFFEVGKDYSFKEIKERLIMMQYKPILSNIMQGMFEIRGESIDIYSSTEKVLYRLHFSFETLEHIEIRNAATFEAVSNAERITIWPATQYLQDDRDVKQILSQIEVDMIARVAEFEWQGKLVEAERLRKKTLYDMKMIQETGFTNGIENYSPYFEQRLEGGTPNTIFNYFPDDFLLIVDESHMTLPQLRAMPQGDKSRKQTLIDHGFRLPSAIHHRPLSNAELTEIMGWKAVESIKKDVVEHWDDTSVVWELWFVEIQKKQSKTLFVSATPSAYELEQSRRIVQQVIRPTWLLDPITYVYPKSGNYDILFQSVDKLLKKKPHLGTFLDHYSKLHVNWKVWIQWYSLF